MAVGRAGAGDDDQGKERGPADPVGLNGGLFVGMMRHMMFA